MLPARRPVPESHMKSPRRQFLHLAASAVALSAVSRFAWAQSYPAPTSGDAVPAQ
jgi:hypothetical protein